jgi:hypothetical protein
MKQLNRREFVKLAAVAGTGAFMPEPLKVFTDAINQIIGTKHIASKVEYVPKPIKGARFGMVIAFLLRIDHGRVQQCITPSSVKTNGICRFSVTTAITLRVFRFVLPAHHIKTLMVLC